MNLEKTPQVDLNQTISGQLKNAAAIYELVETMRQQNDWLSAINRKLEDKEGEFGSSNSN
ncbi:MAG: hypothetical protein ABJH72_08170 [Reichenbachiella sp.]|uniref:hypothetical protein n=1 Tax=Reichenbachiella sp. TaxID=2184521 RepID=UPI003264D772